MNILAFIPARGGSKGIPMKNLKVLNGKHLLDYSIESASDSKLINRIIVSSDNHIILERAKKMGVETVKRPKRISSDLSTIESAMEHCLEHLNRKEKYVPDLIVLLQNTSPLRTARHVDEAISLFLKNRYDSILSGYSSHHFIWRRKNNKVVPVNYDPQKRPNRQQFNDQFIENGAIYVTKYDAFKKSHCRVSGNIGMYVMPVKLSVDIDTREDLVKAEQIMKKRN